jgi:peroxiredoxin Q/BCP
VAADYPILSDPSGAVARAYGVAGRAALWASRHIVYIARDGRVLHVDRRVEARTAGTRIVERLGWLGIPRQAKPSAGTDVP